MADTENKKQITEGEMILGFMILFSIIAYQKRVLIETFLIQRSDDLMFLGWIGFLVLIYLRLKTTHKEMAKERQQLLRLKALEHREREQEEVPETDFNRHCREMLKKGGF